MKIEKFLDKEEEIISVDIPTFSTELGVDATSLLCISLDGLDDAITIERFEHLCNTIIELGESFSMDDNTVVYELDQRNVVISKHLGIRFVIFEDVLNRQICKIMREVNI